MEQTPPPSPRDLAGPGFPAPADRLTGHQGKGRRQLEPGPWPSTCAEASGPAGEEVVLALAPGDSGLGSVPLSGKHALKRGVGAARSWDLLVQAAPAFRKRVSCNLASPRDLPTCLLRAHLYLLTRRNPKRISALGKKKKTQRCFCGELFLRRQAPSRTEAPAGSQPCGVRAPELRAPGLHHHRPPPPAPAVFCSSVSKMRLQASEKAEGGGCWLSERSQNLSSELMVIGSFLYTLPATVGRHRHAAPPKSGGKPCVSV